MHEKRFQCKTSYILPARNLLRVDMLDFTAILLTTTVHHHPSISYTIFVLKARSVLCDKTSISRVYDIIKAFSIVRDRRRMNGWICSRLLPIYCFSFFFFFFLSLFSESRLCVAFKVPDACRWRVLWGVRFSIGGEGEQIAVW